MAEGRVELRKLPPEELEKNATSKEELEAMPEKRAERVELEKLPTEELEKVAREELGETPEKRSECLAELRHLLEEVADTFQDLNLSTEDLFLLRFLRVSKFNVKKAHGRVLRYLDGMKKYEEDYKQMNVDDTWVVLQHKIIQGMPKITKDKKQTVLLKWNMWDPNEIPFEQLMRSIIFTLEKLIGNPEYPQFQILGINIIFDCKGFSWKQLYECKPLVLLRAVTIIYNMLPIRISSLHFLNMSYVFRVIYKMAYPIIPEKIQKRAFIHGSDFDEIHKTIDKDCLTENVGGTALEIDEEFLRELIYYKTVYQTETDYQ